MKFGLQKTTLLDYPGKVAAILFTPGCNLRCPYCHNPELVSGGDDEGLISLDEVRAFLLKRSSVLGGVVITGGEPLLHGNKILDLINEIHSLGLSVKIDTNGLFPDLLPLLGADFIAMDLKTSPLRYGELGCGMPDYQERLKRSARWIIESGIEHQFRTTLCEDFIKEKDVSDMADLIQGCQSHRITPFRPGRTLHRDWIDKPAPSGEYVEMIKELFIKKGIPSHTA